jgi:hypothetical protein
MSKSSERQAWTKFVEEHEAERKPKRPRGAYRRRFRPTQAGLEAELDDLVTEHISETSSRGDAKR